MMQNWVNTIMAFGVSAISPAQLIGTKERLQSNRWDSSAIDDELASGDCRGPVRCNKGDELGNLLGRVGSAQRNTAKHIH